MKELKYTICFILLISIFACNDQKGSHAGHEQQASKEIYTCPMHPQIIRDKPGQCPICGMDLVKKESGGEQVKELDLESLLKPTNEFVVSAIPITTMQKREEQIEVEALGNIAYDTREAGGISARVSGRIERLYVKFRYQRISKGQHILDIYSPELLTAQQNFLFLLKNDAGNKPMIDAAKERLSLLGISQQQISKIIQTGQPSLTIPVYSNYRGHIHEAAKAGIMNNEQEPMNDVSLLTKELPLKEGMYVQKGETIFNVYNPDRAWAILNIYEENQDLIKPGNSVHVTAETAPSKDFKASINFIEPFYRKGSKTLTARVYFDNAVLKIPIGSRVRATIAGDIKSAYWLPKEAVLSLGFDKVVFQRVNGGFKAHKINTGVIHKNYVQVLNGLNENDSVAANGQFLMDSESFIKVKN